MRNEPGPQVVYAIGTTSGATIKIGTTTNLPRRFAAIQAMSPQPLVIHWHTRGGADLEHHLHGVFRERRQHGEWFDFSGDDDVVRLIADAAEAHAAVAESLGAKTQQEFQTTKTQRRNVTPRRLPTAESEVRVPCLPMCPEYNGDPTQPLNAPDAPSCDRYKKPGCLQQVAFLALLGSIG
jgi:hypothetical protein